VARKPRPGGGGPCGEVGRRGGLTGRSSAMVEGGIRSKQHPRADPVFHRRLQSVVGQARCLMTTHAGSREGKRKQRQTVTDAVRRVLLLAGASQYASHTQVGRSAETPLLPSPISPWSFMPQQRIPPAEVWCLSFDGISRSIPAATPEHQSAALGKAHASRLGGRAGWWKSPRPVPVGARGGQLPRATRSFHPCAVCRNASSGFGSARLPQTATSYQTFCVAMWRCENGARNS
jgi:hypothetical protein